MNGKPPETTTGFNEHNINLTAGKKKPKSGFFLMLEEKIIAHLEATTREGLSKGELQKLLMDCEDYMNVSINTIKRAVDGMVEDGTIECVNPDKTNGLRFRVKDGHKMQQVRTRRCECVQ